MSPIHINSDNPCSTWKLQEPQPYSEQGKISPDMKSEVKVFRGLIPSNMSLICQYMSVNRLFTVVVLGVSMEERCGSTRGIHGGEVW